MTVLEALLGVAVLLWPLSEIVLSLVRRSRGVRGARALDQGSGTLIWVAIAAGITLAVVCSGVPATRLRLPAALRLVAALLLLLAGLGLRIWAIVTLGRFFTVDVALHEGQRVVREGPYRWVRHPSYAGALIAFVGAGLAMDNALSLLFAVVPFLLAVLRRIAVEERALVQGLGEEYAAYARVTKRLVPGLY
ncbi:MAG TPA: isoprenylcysteine carboxylmethyltransferase family protein [Candidatus Eisenbacteria bacterium]